MSIKYVFEIKEINFSHLSEKENHKCGTDQRK